MSDRIYVLIDHAKNQIRTASLETLAFGQRMGREAGLSVHPLMLGSKARRLAEGLARTAANSVLLIEEGKLEEYDPDIYCEALRQILTEDQPHLLLMAHTYQNIDLAPKLAAAVNRALVTDCIGFRKDDSGLVFIRQMFRNKINVEARIRSQHPWMLTVQSGAASADDLQAGSTEIVQRSIDLSGVQLRRQTIEAYEAVKGKVDLSKAEVIVAVGRGIKKEENLKIVEELAKVLGAEIGASRPVVDNQWLSRDRQIGSSGQTVSPRLYIACGISGAIQHLVGMKNSQCIVAINTDPNAPIFNIATYGIVGDLHEVVPVLTRKLREIKGQ